MNRRLAVILVLASLTVLAPPADAAFENLMVSPRARAMGDAGVAVADATYATYLNPANLTTSTSEVSVGASYVQPYALDFHRLYYLGSALQMPNGAGTLGVGFQQYGVEYENVDLLTESTFSLAYGLTLVEDLHSTVSVGASLNMYRLEFGETVGGLKPGDDSAAGVDLGLMVTLHDRTRMGVLIHNLNAPKIGIDEEELPRRLHGGVAYAPYDGVVTTFEIENAHGEKVQWRGGLEFEVADGFMLRSGIMTQPNKLTAGFGYAIDRVQLDYGFSTGGGVLDSSHQFGVRWDWGGENK